MKIIVYLFLLFSATSWGQVGIGTNQPHPSAALDIQSSDKGVLLPRVSLNSIDDPTIGSGENVTSERSLPSNQSKDSTLIDKKKNNKEKAKKKEQRKK